MEITFSRSFGIPPGNYTPAAFATGSSKSHNAFKHDIRGEVFHYLAAVLIRDSQVFEVRLQGQHKVAFKADTWKYVRICNPMKPPERWYSNFPAGLLSFPTSHTTLRRYNWVFGYSDDYFKLCPAQMFVLFLLEWGLPPPSHLHLVSGEWAGPQSLSFTTSVILSRTQSASSPSIIYSQPALVPIIWSFIFREVQVLING